MATPAQLALALGRSLGTTRAYLRAGRVSGARKEGRRWEVPAAAVQDAYGQRADVHFQRGAAIPREAHYPNPDLTDAWRYQFVYTARLHFEDGGTETVTDFSVSIRTEPGDPKPSSRRLRALLREYIRRRYTEPAFQEEYREDRGRRVRRVVLLEAHILRAQRRA